MLECIKNESNMTLTENGATTYESTGSDCVDLFAAIGALRSASADEIVARFMRAYTENPDVAMKILFFARDVRGGLGERRVFRIIVNWLADNEPASVKKNMEYIAEFGRYDDLLALMGTSCEDMMLKLLHDQYEIDCKAMEAGESVSLLAKWLPSINASNREAVKTANKIAKSWGMNAAAYRKGLSALRSYINIIENNLREKNYTFDYEKQPSRALYKYRAAFYRNDSERYEQFLSKVENGTAKLNTSNVSPYELVAPYLIDGWTPDHCFMKAISEGEKRVLNATWESLPDFGGEENAIAVIDTSGSMYCTASPSPASVALSLGLYFAERNRGVFRNHFIEFSDRPQLIEIKGETFADRLRYISSFEEIANTDLEAVFDLILKAAVDNHVSQEELPAKLIIISDMEFDSCVENGDLTNFENAKSKYAQHGYRLPEIVFWNVASRRRNQPVRKNDQGVCLVSGVTPRLFSMIAGNQLSPYEFMMEAVCSERYARIVA